MSGHGSPLESREEVAGVLELIDDRPELTLATGCRGQVVVRYEVGQVHDAGSDVETSQQETVAVRVMVAKPLADLVQRVVTTDGPAVKRPKASAEAQATVEAASSSFPRSMVAKDCSSPRSSRTSTPASGSAPNNDAALLEPKEESSSSGLLGVDGGQPSIGLRMIRLPIGHLHDHGVAVALDETSHHRPTAELVYLVQLHAVAARHPAARVPQSSGRRRSAFVSRIPHPTARRANSSAPIAVEPCQQVEGCQLFGTTEVVAVLVAR